MINDPRERFDVKIETDHVCISMKMVSRGIALEVANGILRDFPEDNFVQKNMPDIIRSFGLMSTAQGKNHINIDGYLPRSSTGEKHTCPRRITELGPWEHKENLDDWDMIGDDKCCSFCGSLHPERLIELVKQYGWGIVEFSDKGYKVYVRRNNVPNASYGGIKYYRQHDTDQFLQQWASLVATSSEKTSAV